MASGRHTRSRPRKRFRAGAPVGFILGAAGSIATTIATAAVVGYQADRILQPIEFTLRVVLLLAAPCVGAAAANWLVIALAGRHVEPPPAWSVGLGAVVGPALALALRLNLDLDRLTEYGPGFTLVTLAVMGAWAFLTTMLTSAIARRSTPTDHTAFPPPTTQLPPTGQSNERSSTLGDDAPTDR